LRRLTLAVLACLPGLGAAGCTDGTTPDCADAQCLPVLVEAAAMDAGDAADDAPNAEIDGQATPAPDGG